MGLIDYKVNLNSDVKLHHYDRLLNRFKQWTQFKRDIKLTSLLEGKRIQYDVEDISNMYGYMGLRDDYVKLASISTISMYCFDVKSMSFIINGDNIESLSLKVEIMPTPFGKEVMALEESNIKLLMKQCIIEDCVNYFYLDTDYPKTAA